MVSIDITDGASNTACFSERLKGDWSNATASPRTDLFQPGTPPATPDEALATCRAMNPFNLALQFKSDTGAYWIRGFHMTMYQHVFPPNERSCAWPVSGGGNQSMSQAASSAHFGGVNLVFCDGSVRFIRDTINLATWRAIGSRNGKEVYSEDF